MAGKRFFKSYLNDDVCNFETGAGVCEEWQGLVGGGGGHDTAPLLQIFTAKFGDVILTQATFTLLEN